VCVCVRACVCVRVCTFLCKPKKKRTILTCLHQLLRSEFKHTLVYELQGKQKQRPASFVTAYERGLQCM